MAIGDELDTLLASQKMDESDYEGLAQILDLGFFGPSDARERFSKEIRHNYGHAIINIFRNWNKPDYIDIVKSTAIKLKINYKDHHTIEDLENKIIIEVLEIAKSKITKEHGAGEWKRIEKDTLKDIDKLIKEGTLPKTTGEEILKARGLGLMGMLTAGKLAGFALYIVANQTFFTIARFIGIKIGVAVAGPIIGGTLSFLLGPAGWLIAGMLVLFDLGDTNWKKTIPSVVTIAALRRKHGFA